MKGQRLGRQRAATTLKKAPISSLSSHFSDDVLPAVHAGDPATGCSGPDSVCSASP